VTAEVWRGLRCIQQNGGRLSSALPTFDVHLLSSECSFAHQLIDSMA